MQVTTKAIGERDTLTYLSLCKQHRLPNEGLVMRPLHEIAKEIEWECADKAWYVYAEAYVTPMKSLTSMSDTFYADSADSIVRYALANLTSWRGDSARRIKAELNGMLKGVSA